MAPPKPSPKTPRRKSLSRASRSNADAPHTNSKPAATSTPMATPTPRKRHRASEFASKSVKRQTPRTRLRRLQDEARNAASVAGDEPDSSVDDIIRNVRSLINSGSPGPDAALRDALRRADSQFRTDLTPPPSSEDEPAFTVPAVKKKQNGDTSNHASPPGPLESASVRKRKLKTPASKKKAKKQTKASKNDNDEDSDFEISARNHRADIDALKRDDPDFYKFLAENDGSLLDFDSNEDSGEEDAGYAHSNQNQDDNASDALDADESDQMNVDNDETDDAPLPSPKTPSNASAKASVKSTVTPKMKTITPAKSKLSVTPSTQSASKKSLQKSSKKTPKASITPLKMTDNEEASDDSPAELSRLTPQGSQDKASEEASAESVEVLNVKTPMRSIKKTPLKTPSKTSAVKPTQNPSKTPVKTPSKSLSMTLTKTPVRTPKTPANFPAGAQTELEEHITDVPVKSGKKSAKKSAKKTKQLDETPLKSASKALVDPLVSTSGDIEEAAAEIAVRHQKTPCDTSAKKSAKKSERTPERVSKQSPAKAVLMTPGEDVAKLKTPSKDTKSALKPKEDLTTIPVRGIVKTPVKSGKTPKSAKKVKEQLVSVIPQDDDAMDQVEDSSDDLDTSQPANGVKADVDQDDSSDDEPEDDKDEDGAPRPTVSTSAEGDPEGADEKSESSSENDETDDSADENGKSDSDNIEHMTPTVEKDSAFVEMQEEKLSDSKEGKDSQMEVVDDAEPEDPDTTGYSSVDDDDSDAEAEAAAAAEAGIALNSDASEEGSGSDDNSSEPDETMDVDDDDDDDGVEQKPGDDGAEEDANGSKKVLLVDMGFLRHLKELLSSKRAGLKACKDLLRIFRAGRDVLPASSAPKSDKKRKRRPDKEAEQHEDRVTQEEMEEVDEDDFNDDGSFTSGTVKFVSAKAYQQAMNLAIIGIQDTVDRILGRPQGSAATDAALSKWNPTESGRWSKLESVFRPYVYHMFALCDAVEDPSTLRFLLKRLEKFLPYTTANKSLLKKATRFAIKVFSSDAHSMSQATRLRAYLLLNRLAHGPGNTEVVLRHMYNMYSTKIASNCNSKSMPLIHFSVACIVELFGIDMGSSYTVAFSFLREMAVSLRTVLVSKTMKEEVERIHNWTFINQLRLWSKVLSKYGSEDELEPLIFPFVQVSLGVIKVYPTPRTYPLRLHIISFLTDIVAETGVFIPVVPHLLHMLRCSELRKAPRHGDVKTLDWRNMLRVADEAVKTKPFLTGLINNFTLQMSKFFAAISKHVSFPELSHIVETTLKKTAKEMSVTEWKQKLSSLADKLHQTSVVLCDVRSKADFSPHGAVSSKGMLAVVPGIDPKKKMPIQVMFEVERERVSKEGRLRDKQEFSGKRGASTTNGSHSKDVDESDEEPDQAPQAKRRKTKSKSKSKHPTLIAPKVVDDNEQDEIAELNLSDESD